VRLASAAAPVRRVAPGTGASVLGLSDGASNGLTAGRRGGDDIFGFAEVRRDR
jgi:hypothetical protein